jgi:hypothetical protein
LKLTVTAGRLSILAVVAATGSKQRHPRHRRLAYGSLTRSVASATTLTIRIKPSRAARTALKRAKHLRVMLAIKLTSASKATATKTLTVTVHAPRSHR